MTKTKSRKEREKVIKQAEKALQAPKCLPCKGEGVIGFNKSSGELIECRTCWGSGDSENPEEEPEYDADREWEEDLSLDD